jgi:polysaccharide export outer membrane protein
MSGRYVVLIIAVLASLLAGCQSSRRTVGALPSADQAPTEPAAAETTSAIPEGPVSRLYRQPAYRESSKLFGEAPLPAGYDRSLLLSFDTPILDPHNENYRLDTGDVVRVDVFEQTELSRLYRVDDGGFVSVPLIGAVGAGGLTPRGLGQAIAAGLSQSYLKDPKVNVEVSSYRPFFILGEVRNSGQYPYVVGMTVETAVAIAGGYSPRANQNKVEVVRRVQDRLIRTYVPLNTEIRPGDTVKVPERLF